MVSVAESSDRADVQLLVNKINEAWLKGRPQDLQEYFHPEIVIKGPGFEEMARGREACVRSYEDFTRQAKVREFKVSAVAVDLCSNTAVATCPWEITYEMKGQVYHESGQDLFVFTRNEGRWQVIWRAVLTSPPK